MAIRDVLSSSLGGLKKKKKSEAFFQCFYWTKAFPLSDVAVETLQVVLRFYRLQGYKGEWTSLALVAI